MSKKFSVVTDEQLLTALHYAEQVEDANPELMALLRLIVNRLIETGKVFNEHEHRVSGVTTESSDYYSAGEGWTGTPETDIGYGCGKDQLIGIPDPNNKYDEEGDEDESS